MKSPALLPPATASGIHPRIVLWRTGRPFYRTHLTAYGPRYFGRHASSRFDAPDMSFGVLYLGDSPHAAFVETFGHSTGVDAIDESALAARSLAVLTPTRDLRLVDLHGAGLTRLRVDARVTTEIPYTLSQAWAKALHSHPRAPDGLLYRSRHDPSRKCVALFERASSAIEVTATRGWLDPAQVATLATILDDYTLGLI